ncbi:Uncharacterised protein [Mycobacteroides abscessus subsp. abscessus]|nr:Uncharacterised protein [Mycobacteroides abscessus subsp. abscessus]
MVTSASGSRTRRFFALRRLSTVEHTVRTSSMVDTSSGSAGRSAAAGQSARCTERPPVNPRQITSLINGSNGAASRVATSRTVCRVSTASRSSLQNRLRERRTYQLVSASANVRNSSHAPAMS